MPCAGHSFLCPSRLLSACSLPQGLSQMDPTSGLPLGFGQGDPWLQIRRGRRMRSEYSGQHLPFGVSLGSLCVWIEGHIFSLGHSLYSFSLLPASGNASLPLSLQLEGDNSPGVWCAAHPVWFSSTTHFPSWSHLFLGRTLACGSPRGYSVPRKGFLMCCWVPTGL